MSRKLNVLAAGLMLAGCATSTGGPSGSGAPGASSAKAECGEASYYVDSLAGNATASGEAYDPGKLTAAHPSLPFGTELRIVRQDTGAEVSVRVNDRGPYAKDRIVDVSRAAAAKLDLVTAGVADVCIYVK